jgi:hypothetical protein
MYLDLLTPALGAGDGPGALPCLGVVGDAGEQPAQFDRGR